LKKYALKASQPGDRVTTTTIAVMKTTVERMAIATARDSLEPRPVAPPRIRELRFPSSYFRSGAPARARYRLWSFLIGFSLPIKTIFFWFYRLLRNIK